MIPLCTDINQLSRTVSATCVKPTISLQADCAVGELRKLLMSQNESFCIVKDGKRFVNIISDRDILGVHSNRLLMDVRTATRLTIPHTSSVKDAQNFFLESGSDLAVITDDKCDVVGIVRKSDVFLPGNAQSKNEVVEKWTGQTEYLCVKSEETEENDNTDKEYPELAMKFVGTSDAAGKIRHSIYSTKDMNCPVFITGETGTGKQVVATSIHSLCKRKSGPFISVNCATFQDSLFENEFFGHEKGAFTGAVQTKKGLVELADKGILFVDEIGEMSLSIQAKLLHFLEHGIFRRVGGAKELKADVQLIAATNRNVNEMIKAGDFRQDLFYRLNVINIHIPPLRERLADIPDLVVHFLSSDIFKKHGVKKTTRRFFETLLSYKWPGNVRQLQNVLWRAYVKAGQSDVLDGTHLDLDEGHYDEAADVQCMPTRLKESERRHIELVVHSVNGNITKASKLLGISRSTLRRRLSTS